MTELAIATERSRDEITLRVVGDLDLRGGDELEAAVRSMLGTASLVVLDLAEVEFIDSSGLGALIAAEEAARDDGTRLVLRSPSPPVTRVLELTHTSPVFEVDRRAD